MISQRYTIQLPLDYNDKPVPGADVIHNDNPEIVAGYINDYDENKKQLSITFFEPRNI